jgi:hypothetical protein
MPAAAQVDGFLPPYQLPFPLDPRRPVSHGPQIHPEQGPPLQLERARAMEDAIPVIRAKTDEFARVFGRQYPHFVESYRLEDADIAIVISGGHAVTCRAAVNRMRAQGIKIGMAGCWGPAVLGDDRARRWPGQAVGVVRPTSAGAAPATAASSHGRSRRCTTLDGPRRVTSFMALPARPADGRVRLDG